MKRLAISVVAVLAGCGGGNQDNTKAAVAEAMATLEATKPEVTNAYLSNAHAFPTAAKSPIAALSKDAKYIGAMNYNSANSTVASVVVAFANTKSPDLDGSFLAMFATGNHDGTITWMCGTTASFVGTSPASATVLYRYLPPECQH